MTRAVSLEELKELAGARFLAAIRPIMEGENMSRPDLEARALDYLKSNIEEMTERAMRVLTPPTATTKVSFPILLDGITYAIIFDGETWKFSYALAVGDALIAPHMEGDGTGYSDDVRHVTVDLMEFKKTWL